MHKMQIACFNVV